MRALHVFLASPALLPPCAFRSPFTHIRPQLPTGADWQAGRGCRSTWPLVHWPQGCVRLLPVPAATAAAAAFRAGNKYRELYLDPETCGTRCIEGDWNVEAPGDLITPTANLSSVYVRASSLAAPILTAMDFLNGMLPPPPLNESDPAFSGQVRMCAARLAQGRLWEHRGRGRAGLIAKLWGTWRVAACGRSR